MSAPAAGGARRGRAARFAVRVGAVAWKETLHVRRDPRTLVLAFAMPVVMLLLFGYGVSFDVDRIPIAVSDQDRTEASRQLALAFTENGELRAVGGAPADDADTLFRRHRTRAVLVIPQGFAKDLERGGPARVSGGRNGARVFYAILGCGLMTLGLLLAFGVIPAGRAR